MSTHLPLRRLVLKAGIAIGILFLASAVDTFVCSHLDGKTVIRALPGTHQAISGNLNQPVRRAEEVRFIFDDPGLKLTVLDVKGRFWRGELTIPTTAAEGTYRLRATSGHKSDPAAMQIYRITVFPSPAAMNASYPSLIRRLLGIAPWWVVGATAPLLAACLLLSAYLADDRVNMLEKEGLTPIIKLARRKDHWELAASIDHTRHVRPGSVLEVMDNNKLPVARVIVSHLDNGLAFGKLDLTAPVRPDGYVRFLSTDTEVKNPMHDRFTRMRDGI